MAKYRVVIDVDTRRNTSQITAVETKSPNQIATSDFVYLCSSAIIEFAVALHGMDFCDHCIIAPYDMAMDDALDEYDLVVGAIVAEEQEKKEIADTAKTTDDYLKTLDELGVKTSLSAPSTPPPAPKNTDKRPRKPRSNNKSADDNLKSDDNPQNVSA